MTHYICILTRECEVWSECRKTIITFIPLSKFSKYFLKSVQGQSLDAHLDFIILFYLTNSPDYCSNVKNESHFTTEAPKTRE